MSDPNAILQVRDIIKASPDSSTDSIAELLATPAVKEFLERRQACFKDRMAKKTTRFLRRAVTPSKKEGLCSNVRRNTNDGTNTGGDGGISKKKKNKNNKKKSGGVNTRRNSEEE